MNLPRLAGNLIFPTITLVAVAYAYDVPWIATTALFTLLAVGFAAMAQHTWRTSRHKTLGDLGREIEEARFAVKFGRPPTDPHHPTQRRQQ